MQPLKNSAELAEAGGFKTGAPEALCSKPFDSKTSLPEAGKVLPSIAIVGSLGRMGAMLSGRLTQAGYSVEGIELLHEQSEKLLGVQMAQSGVQFSDQFSDQSSVQFSKQFSKQTSDQSGIHSCIQSSEQSRDYSGVLRGAQTSNIAAILGRSRIVLLCVPVKALKSCLSVLAPHLNSRHLLMDITSVKVLPMRWLQEAFAGAVVGTHPMFGPAPKDEDLRVALVRGKNAADHDCNEAEQLFERVGCTIFWTDAEEHDTGVAMSQSLNFTVSAAFLATLARHEGITPYLTPSFKRHMEAARMHLTKDAAMFLEFSSMNPKFLNVIEKFKNTLEEAALGNLDGIAAEAAVWYQNPKILK